MRYQSWDILLFPEGSRIPMQEFKTGCHVLQDPESGQLQTSVTHHLPFPIDQVIPVQLPTVTSFVAGLPHGFPFRVSIHSWEAPYPSPSLLSFKRDDEVVLFEARVLVDGRCLALSLFPSSGPWPQIIDWSSAFDKHGNPQSLNFPPFYNEILAQNWWSAAESIGRVKVIIAEGISREQRDPPFERFKNIATFSFQHAPLEVLEACGIAWPNPQMWSQVPSTTFQNSPRKSQADDHAHSPRRRDDQRASEEKVEAPPPIPFKLRRCDGTTQCPHHPANRPPPPVQAMSIDGGSFDGDPFLNSACHRQGSRKTSGLDSAEDQPMPDYSNSNTTASSSRSATGALHRCPDRHRHGPVTAQSRCDGYDEMIEAFNNTSSRVGVSGTLAPANTRTSSADSTPVHPAPPPSAAAQARTASYNIVTHQRKPSLASHVAGRLANHRIASDASMRSRFSDEASSNKENAEPIIRQTPAMSIRGKKEGHDPGGLECALPTSRAVSTTLTERLRQESGRSKRESDETPKQAPGPQRASSLRVATVPKRKRSGRDLSGNVVDPKSEVQSSPIRKVSRYDAEHGDGQEKGAEEGGRVVLGEVGNGC